MSDSSKIEWTDATWNPVTGCTKVSPGCDHCYAETFAERWRGTPGHHFENGFDVTLRPERLEQPLHWKRPRRIFVNSMSDLFHEAVPDEYIVRVFDVMQNARRHSFQVLTKRHARMRSFVTRYLSGEFATEPLDTSPLAGTIDAPPPNIWLGVSVEDQKWADIRVPALLATPAAVRFLSCEPLLGPIDLRTIPYRGDVQYYVDALSRRYRTCRQYERGTDCSFGLASLGQINWVIAGGESGPGARPMLPAWARSLRDQCQEARTPFLFKQWGAWGPTGAVGIGGTDPRRGFVGAPVDEHGCREEIARLGKGRTGRELDGRTWDEYPRVWAAA
jgi:protein gp37